MSSPGSLAGEMRGRQRIVFVLLIVIAVFAAFAPALSSGFVDWDDDRNFVANSAYRGLSFAHLKWMVTTFHGGPYQPLAWFTLAIDHALWGMDARGYHLTNVVLHACTAVAFFFFARRLLPLCASAFTGSMLDFGATSASLLFALHPLRVESVAWVTERRDVLSGVFFVLTLLAYVRSRTSSEMRVRRSSYILALVGLFLSLAAKASGMTMPLVLLAIDVWPLRRPLKESIADKIPFALLVVPFAVLALWGQAEHAHTLSTIEEHGVLERVAQASFAAVFYPMKTLLPLDLAPIYDLPVPFDPFAMRFVLAIVCAVGATALLFALRRRAPAAWTAWIVFLVIAAPTSGLAKAGPQLVADRYSYLACMPFALLAAGALFELAPRVALAIALLAVSTLGVLTFRQTRTWHDSESLWEHSVAANPTSYIAHTNLGFVLRTQGHLDEALEHYARALELSPRYALAHNSLGQVLATRGHVDEALPQFRAAVEIDPKYVLARVNLGLALKVRGDLDGAETELREAVRLAPDNADVHTTLGDIFVSRNKGAEAIAEYEAALAIDAADPQAHCQLARVLALQGRARLAIEHYRAALHSRPRWPEVEIDLAWILATHKNAELRNAAEAVSLANDAVRLMGTPTARTLDVLAAAYASAGRFDEARDTAQRALALASDPKLAAAIESRLKLYAAREPYLAGER
jgi:tetratricopeptide (TPR) repeat protein